MIRNETASLANSLWSATSNPAPRCPPLSGDAETEVAVIGGGFTGLSAALHLAEAGTAVTVLEAEQPGWGASGRNGGQVNPGLKEDPDAVEARFGPQMGARMIKMAGGSADLVFALIERHGIDCAATRPGWVQPVHDEAALKTVRSRVEQWRRRGASLRMMSRHETADILGTDSYVAAMIDERGGQLHPLNYALGLAHAAQKSGAILHGDTRAIALERQGVDHLVRCQEGTLRARRVLVCTNGYTDEVAPRLRRSVVPIRSVQIATEPLGGNIRKSILPYGHSASDSRRLLLYFRLDADGRFVMGGRGAYSERGLARQIEALRQVSQQLYPQLRGVPWAHQWGGYVAMTSHHYPILTSPQENVIGALGYNGRGVGMATAMGAILARWASGEPVDSLDYPVTKTRPLPFHFLKKPAVSAAVAWSGLRDSWS